jgi:ribonucleoside-diphosphate reductase alpha chain
MSESFLSEPAFSDSAANNTAAEPNTSNAANPGTGTAVAAARWQVTKRDGRVVPWSRARVERAIRSALASVSQSSEWKELPGYGLNPGQLAIADQIVATVENQFASRLNAGEAPGVEQVQDAAERALAQFGQFDAAKAFILYRASQARNRTSRIAAKPNGLQDYIAVSKYARYNADLKRREVWPEPVERVCAMHQRRFAYVDNQLTLALEQGSKPRLFLEQIADAFAKVSARRVLPSMRSLQFGGPAIENEEARMFNCAFTFINRIEAFSETLWLLLCGTGTGFSVQKRHINALPAFPVRSGEDELPVVHHRVGDTIKGWADALNALVRSYLQGTLVEFDYSEIRPKGTPLRTSGGKAPGHVPLRRSLDNIRKILDRVPGRRIKPIEAYDILMYAARAVLSGGIRRSATICLFSADDEEMNCAKTGKWFEENPQRAASNNSAVINRHTTPQNVFLDLFEKQKEFGEPGFYFVENEDYGANPCVEIGLAPFAEIRDEAEIARLRELGCNDILLPGQRVYGWQMCNLTTINAAACNTPEEFYESCRAAALIGTLQASYVRMPYLGPVSQFINEREALLGVSITGILDNPGIFLDPAVLEAGAAEVRKENARVAALIGIPAAARTTCIKPEGTASLLLGTSSGIHPHHAKRYFRRVLANRLEQVYQHFRAANPGMTERSTYNANDDVITFPVQARSDAIIRDDLRAVDFLAHVRLVQQHWVQAGRAHEKYNPGLHHNVSNTCVVRPEEWDEVAAFIWENRAYFTGIALLPFTGDKVYAQAPNEAVVTEADQARWNALNYVSVDYTTMHEDKDNTALKEISACAGGNCEVV